MKVTTRRRIVRSTTNPDVGTYQTSVRVECGGVLIGLTFPGLLTRKRALEETFHFLQRSGQYSPSFLHQIPRH